MFHPSVSIRSLILVLAATVVVVVTWAISTGQLAEWGNRNPPTDQRLIKDVDEKELIASLGSAVGDESSGAGLFVSSTCITCHLNVETDHPIAPSLCGSSKRMTRIEMIEAILYPSAKIAKGFETVQLLAIDGKTTTGLIFEETEKVIRVRQPNGDVVELSPDSIEMREPTAISPMPEQLVDLLTVQQFADLIAYIESLSPE